MNWKTTAFIFPGQGSQSVGMGQSIANAFPIAQQTFEHANDILGLNFSDMLFNGTVEELNDTYNTQPALFITSVATLRALQTCLPQAVPTFSSGHSLGEYTALVASGAISFEIGLRLVRERARLMREAGEAHHGAMGVFLGISVDVARQVCEEASHQTHEPLVIANDNCPGQIVISGGARAVDFAIEYSKQVGAKRSQRLALSVAAHSPLMASAAEQFNELLQTVQFESPRFAVYGNVTAEPLTTPADIIAELSQQIVAPVRWTESVQHMIRDGAQTFIEIGNGDVLSGLVKRIDQTVTRMSIQSHDTLESFVQSIAL